MKASFACVAAAVLFAAAPALAGPQKAIVTAPPAAHLPVWDIGAKWPGRAMLFDQYGTYRSNNPDHYRVTQPVTGTLRAYAEFEPAGHMIIAWDVGTFDDIYVQMINPVYKTTTVLMLHNGSSAKNRIVSALQSAGIATSEINDPAKFLFVNTPLDAFWTRDYGPIPAVDASGDYVAVDFAYYWERVYDDGAPFAVAQALNVALERPDLKYEGGNFMTNGKGLCMATKGSYWNNLPEDGKAVAKIFRDYLGCEKTVFLTPLAGEGTTHIDMFAKILDETTVIIGKYDYQQDCADAMLLDDNAALLEATTTVDGKPLNVVRIPMPNNSDGVWRTYTNSLLVNNMALVPVYANDRTYETEALKVYADALPGWTIVPIDSDDIIPDGGAMHCITMTTPMPPYQRLVDPAALCGASAYTCVTAGCGSITSTGYCDDNVAIWCENGTPQTYDCATPCHMVSGGYPCEQACGLKSGNYDCTANLTCCQPVCAGKTCGQDDGCGHKCTACTNPGETCDTTSWTCTGCVPSCAGRECGPDGCAGLCGQCAGGDACVNGHCQPNANDGGAADSGADGSMDDAGATDAGVRDAGAADGGEEDAGTDDAGMKDAGTADAGSTDTGSDVSHPSDVSFDAGTDGGRADGGTRNDGGQESRDGEGGNEDDSGGGGVPPDEAGATGCSCAMIES